MSTPWEHLIPDESDDPRLAQMALTLMDCEEIQLTLAPLVAALFIHSAIITTQIPVGPARNLAVNTLYDMVNAMPPEFAIAFKSYIKTMLKTAQ